MAERPIILFGQPNKAEKANRGGGSTIIQKPSHSRQSVRIAPKLKALQNAVATITPALKCRKLLHDGRRLSRK
jgi:hypothetical protein